MSPLRLIAFGIALFVLGFLLLYVAGNADTPDPYHQIEFRDPLPEWFFVFNFFAVSLCGAGIWLFLRGVYIALGGRVRKRLLPRIFPEMELRNWTAWKGKRNSPSLVITSLNSFSVLWMCVLLILLIIFVIFHSARTSKGLYINWVKRSHIAATESPWAETMSIYIRADGDFLVNGKAIHDKSLESMLREELGHRVVWTVYLEANKDTAFTGTVHAIDTIQGLGGKVVWITPKIRKEWKEQAEEKNGWPSPKLTPWPH